MVTTTRLASLRCDALAIWSSLTASGASGSLTWMMLSGTGSPGAQLVSISTSASTRCVSQVQPAPDERHSIRTSW